MSTSSSLSRIHWVSQSITSTWTPSSTHSSPGPKKSLFSSSRDAPHHPRPFCDFLERQRVARKHVEVDVRARLGLLGRQRPTHAPPPRPRGRRCSVRQSFGRPAWRVSWPRAYQAFGLDKLFASYHASRPEQVMMPHEPRRHRAPRTPGFGQALQLPLVWSLAQPFQALRANHDG